MLGKLYQPKGKALETAQAVLEKDNVYAVNVAWGCRNCTYCYNRRRTGDRITYPKEPVIDIVLKQFEKGLEPFPEGVFLSFGCEPLLKENIANTWALIRLLRGYNIRVAVLSKMGVIGMTDDYEIRHGATIVSLSRDFWGLYEPNAEDPLKRLDILKFASEEDNYTWLSIEPYPCPAIFKQDLKPFLDQLGFVNFMIFGKWNYDSRCNTQEAREFYKQAAAEFVDFCKAYGIRYHVKSDTGGKNAGL